MDLFRQNLQIEMIRPDLKGLPETVFPPGYSLRWFRSGDAAHWMRIHHDADPFNEITPELFNREFGCDFNRLQERQCYVQDGMSRVVGTGTAWSADERTDGRWGRVFWLAIHRQYQGRGLGKPLLGAICHRLHELGHDRACVITSTGRLPAVSLYLQFGFQPEIRSDTDRIVWKRITDHLKSQGRLKEPAAAA
jgi:GNAT superfamily N-acetyltransferase